MTVVAWDGRFLVADKQATCEGHKYQVSKLFRVKTGMVAAITGAYDGLEACIKFLNNEGPYPYTDIDKSGWGRLIVVDNGKLYWYETTEHKCRMESAYIAFGNGRDFALMGMHLGFGAEASVRQTCKINNTCGFGMTIYDSISDTITEELFNY